MKKFLLIVTIMLWASTAHAANWYLDKAATGSSNGTTWANAWTSPSSVIWGSSGVKAGDTLYISAGTYGNLSIGASGTSTSQLTIMAAQDAGHTGVAVFDGGGTGPAITTNNNSYLTINGNFNGSRNIKAQNGLLSAGLYGVISGVPTGSGSSNYAPNCHILYVEVATGAIGINFHNQGANPLEIANCYIHDVRGQTAIDITTCGNRSSYGLILIHNNVISTDWALTGATESINGPDGLQAYGSVDYYNNDVSGYQVAPATLCDVQHPDLIQAQAEYWRIYNNKFHDIGDSCIDFDAFYQLHIQHVQIYNNTFSNDTYQSLYPWGIRFYKSNGGNITDFSNVTIANNTFADKLGQTYSLYVKNTVGMTISNVLIQNNIFYDSDPISLGADNTSISQSSWNFDYNDINAGSHGSSSVNLSGGSYTQAHPRTGAPVFVSYAQYSPSNDFHLSLSDTAAKGQGVNLSAYFTTDKDGNLRAATGAWDIGAYAASTSTPVPAPPTSLKVQ